LLAVSRDLLQQLAGYYLARLFLRGQYQSIENLDNDTSVAERSDAA
jgi:hypothetical protein